jgi:8-oxo-dGTP pyrophosphatase MutT (NUDIX family)
MRSVGAVRPGSGKSADAAIEGTETIQHAAQRELFEESGIAGVAICYLGAVQVAEPEQEWHFVICKVGQLAETWTHHTSDGGGLDFEFFWHPIKDEPNETWHPIFKQALAFIVQHIPPGHGSELTRC